MAEDKGYVSSLIEAGGGIGQAALAGGLPQALMSKNPVTVLSEQATALVAVGGMGLVAVISSLGIIYLANKSMENSDEKEQQAMRFAYSNFRGQ